jgi:hypothetical protein
MRKVSYVLLMLCLFLPFAGFGQSATSWVGNYSFSEDGGKNAGGTAIFISHELNVMETDDGLIATLQSNGYQTSKDLNCKAKAEGTKLLIYFDGYGENNIFEPYRPGELLLTLETKTAKGKTELLTYWGKFFPVIPKNEKTGKLYFTKSGYRR